MANKPQEKWQNIRVRSITIKRLRILKAQQEVSVYDDVINSGLDLLEEEMDDNVHTKKEDKNK